MGAETGTKWFEFGCNLCQKRFFTQDLLREHVKLHVGWPCNECLHIFEIEDEFKEHQCNGFKSVAIETAEPLKCLQDKIKKEKEEQLIIKSGQYHCIECNRYFKSGQSLGGHRSRVHSKKQSVKRKKSIKRKKKKKEKKILKKDKSAEIDILDDYDNEEQNELDILVGRRLKKNENKMGVDIFGEYVNNDSNKKKEIKNIESLKDCPARHGLVKQLTPNNRVFECNECNNTLYLNEWIYACRWCNFDLCIKCYYGTENEECKTMRCDDIEQETNKDIALDSVPKKSKAKVCINRTGKSLSPRKKRKFMIRIPRSKKRKELRF